MCQEKESTNHVLLKCPIATFVWCIIRDALELSCLSERFEYFKFHLQQFFFLWGGGGLVFVGVLWLTRNNWVFENVLIKSPMQVVYQQYLFVLDLVCYPCKPKFRRLKAKGFCFQASLKQLMVFFHSFSSPFLFFSLCNNFNFYLSSILLVVI